MVLYDYDGVAFVYEAVQDVDESCYMVEVEADGGFFDEVEVSFDGFGDAFAPLFDGPAVSEFGVLRDVPTGET